LRIKNIVFTFAPKKSGVARLLILKATPKMKEDDK